jgi:predicted GNAT family N-acyltransferase
MIIKEITANQTYDLRHKILRPNQTLDDCQYPLDMKSDTIHLGAFLNGQLVSIASFFHEKSDSFSFQNQYRLRGMATLPEFRNQKTGSELIKKAESIMKEKKAEIWWCNARTTVSNYYLKLGLEIEGIVFDIHPIGPHVLMWKRFI